MKKITLSLFLSVMMLGIVTINHAQQTAQYTHYLFNHFGLHPAVAGSKPCVEMRLGYRTQWVSFPGAPKTGFGNIHGRINRKKKGFLRSIHGWGVNAESDQMGPFGITRLHLAYAYHVPVGRSTWLSMGLYAGIQQWRVDVSKMTVWDYNDPALNGGNRFVYPDVSPGAWLYSEDFYIGFTIQQILLNKVRIFPDTRLKPSVIVTAGKKLDIGRAKSLVPSVCFKWSAVSAPALDLNLLFLFSDRFVIGATYRNTDALAIMARISFLRNFSVGYAFDYTTSRIRLGSNNTHEMIVGINTCKPDKRNSTECPVF